MWPLFCSSTPLNSLVDFIFHKISVILTTSNLNRNHIALILMWKSFFLYTRGEQRGIIVLLILIMIVLVVRFSMPYWASRNLNSQEVDEDFVKQVHELNAQLVEQNEIESIDSFFYFNPNKVTNDQLKALGFSNYQRKSFLGYRSKVKNFSSDTDLLKVYGIDSAFFAKLQGYIVLDKSIKSLATNDESIPKKSTEEIQWVNFNKQNADFWDENIASDSIRLKIRQMVVQNYITKSLPLQKIQDYTDEELLSWIVKNSKPRFKDNTKDANLPFKSIELNTADTAQLCHLKGIGSKLSLRIVNFRNSLGGFYHVLQLSEVYGISDELFDNLRNQVTVDKIHMQKLRPQSLSIEEISKHPYINYYQAKELKNLYRKNKTPSAADIIQLKSISENDWEKLKYYLIMSE